MILCQGQTSALRYRVIWCDYVLVTKNNSDYFFSSWWILQVYFHSFPDGILKNISWIFSMRKYTPSHTNTMSQEWKSVFKHLFVKPSEFRIWASGRTTCSCPSCTWNNKQEVKSFSLIKQSNRANITDQSGRAHTNCLLRGNYKMYQRTGLFWS